jgi:mono/diheme cytochrome c family protein
MNTRTLALSAALLTAAAAIVIGCGPSRRDALVSPPVNTESNAQLAEGQRVFTTTCNQCHPGGAAGLGPALNNKPFHAPLMKFQVRWGVGSMPRFSRSQISDEQLNDVILYVKALRRQPVRS